MKFATAVTEYDNASWKFTSEMHALLSKARRLTSPTIFTRLEKHLREWHELDVKIVRLARAKNNIDALWQPLLEDINKQAQKAQEIMQALAEDYKLVPQPRVAER